MFFYVFALCEWSIIPVGLDVDVLLLKLFNSNCITFAYVMHYKQELINQYLVYGKHIIDTHFSRICSLLRLYF